MNNLLKKLKTKDFVEIIPSKNLEEDAKIINNFFRKIDSEKGKILKIEEMEKIDSWCDHGADEAYHGIYTENNLFYLIHYKCYKKIEYDSSK